MVIAYLTRVNIAYRVTHLYANEISARDGRHSKILVSWIETFIFMMGVIIHARLFGVLREKARYAHDITYAGHYEKSLLRDNDSRCYLPKMKIIFSFWTPLLRRLLIANKKSVFF